MVLTNQNILEAWQYEEDQSTFVVCWCGVHFKLQGPSTYHYSDDIHINEGNIICPLDAPPSQVDATLLPRWVEVTNVSIDSILGTQ